MKIVVSWKNEKGITEFTEINNKHEIERLVVDGKLLLKRIGDVLCYQF
jgi:hypothetical protein